MVRSKKVHLASLHVTQDKKVLIDLLETGLVEKAFFEAPKVLRKLKSRWYLDDSKWYFDGDNDAIFGARLIRPVVYRGEQDYDPSTGSRKKNKKRMHDSPSAFFIVSLKTHTLAWYPETVNPPKIEHLEQALKKCFKWARKAYIEEISKKRSKSPKEYSDQVRAVSAEFSEIKVEVVPHSSLNLAHQMLARITRLASFKVQIVADNNNRLDFNPMFEGASALKKEAKLENLTLTGSSKSSTGIDPETIEQLLDHVAKRANGRMQFKGYDDQKKEIIGDTEDNLTLKVPIQLPEQGEDVLLKSELERVVKKEQADGNIVPEALDDERRQMLKKFLFGKRSNGV